ncbi:MAG: hypothetical protein JW919_01610 [Candidatus Omnitrophica bacterium]|nr:hypothetical protein [Candidatus Omnitrophota bacterium]
MKRLVLVTIMTAWFLAGSCLAQDMGGVPSSVRTPEQIAEWFTSEFQYRIKIPDRPQSASETLRLKSGDCDDLATLASLVLSDLGIDSNVVIIKFQGLNIRHAICIWKDKDGTYSFLSNKELQRTGQRDIRGAIRKFYPDMESIAFLDAGKEYSGNTAGVR